MVKHLPAAIVSRAGLQRLQSALGSCFKVDHKLLASGRIAV